MLVISLVVLIGVFSAATVGALTQRSAVSVIGYVGLDLFMSGDSYISPEKTDAKIEARRQKNANYTVPDIYKTLYSFSIESFDSFQVCYFGQATDKKIIYFHGGSFMWQPQILHYSYCKDLSETLGAQVIMPIYPKAPEYGYDYVCDWLYRFYSSLQGEFVFVGDSAGGGILLSFSQYLADRGMTGATDLIAISPMLDISLSNPEIEDYAPLDPFLNRDDLARKAATYAKDADPADPYVSPLYCDYSKIGKVTVITGTYDILYPDTKLLDARLTELGIDHNYLVYENQTHVFALYPMPEKTLCLNKIKTILS